MTETRAWVIAESIDAIMDIYAEDETDVIAADINLIPRLTSSISYFKGKASKLVVFRQEIIRQKK